MTTVGKILAQLPGSVFGRPRGDRIGAFALMLGVTLGGALVAVSAHAADPDPCGTDMVCASNPKSVVKALQAAGMGARLTKSDSTGDPLIGSGVAGYAYSVQFLECEKHERCGSLIFAALPAVQNPTLDLANKMNSNLRFITAAVVEKALLVTMSVSTTGGLNQKNFLDVLSDWSSALQGVDRFLKK